MAGEGHWVAVGAVGTVAGAAIALAAWLWPSGNSASAARSTQNGSAPTSALAGHPPKSWDTSPPADIVRWHGTIGLNVEGSYLDDIPPKGAIDHTGDIAFYSVYQDITEYSNIGQGTLSRWYGSSQPTRQQCSDLIDTHPQTDVGNIRSGVDICVRTAQNRIAYVRVLDVNNYVADLDVTVWELP